MKHTRPTVLYAGAVRDAAGVNARPGAVMVYNGRVHYAGAVDGMNPELVELSEVIDKTDCLLLPAMVNAHTHLELTDIGDKPYHPREGFVGWIKQVRQEEPATKEELVASAKMGAKMCLEAGVQAVGDITRSGDVSRAVHGSGLWGFSYRELFGLGPPFDEQALAVVDDFKEWALENDSGQIPFRLGLQPHAPYSAGDSIFKSSSSRLNRCCTHLAETREEAEFVGKLSGPIREYLESLGRWKDSFAGRYGRGLSPVQWLRPHLEASNGPNAAYGNWLVAHCNYVDDADIRVLADTRTSVAYCPIASEYFGHTEHRYRDMLKAGVNVCLGTDSIVGTDPNDSQPLGLLGAMRRLYQRDGIDPETLLAMATTHGALALLLEPNRVSLQPRAYARFACIPIDVSSEIDPLIQVLTGQDPVEAISFDS